MRGRSSTHPSRMSMDAATPDAVISAARCRAPHHGLHHPWIVDTFGDVVCTCRGVSMPCRTLSTLSHSGSATAHHMSVSSPSSLLPTSPFAALAMTSGALRCRRSWRSSSLGSSSTHCTASPQLHPSTHPTSTPPAPHLPRLPTLTPSTSRGTAWPPSPPPP